MSTYVLATSNTEQLENDLEFERDAVKRAVIIDQLISSFAYTDIKRANEYLIQQHQLLKFQSLPQLQLNYHANAAFIENQYYNYPIAEHHFKKALAITQEIGDLKQQATLQIDYAGVCTNLDRLKKANELLDKARQYLKRYPDQVLQGRLICRESYVTMRYREYGQAIEQLLEADKILNTPRLTRTMKDFYYLSLIQGGLGSCYEWYDNDLEKSVKHYLKSLAICHENGLGTRLSWHYLNVGKAFMGMLDIEKAQHYFRRAIEITDMVSNEARAFAYANLGYCFFLTEKYDQVAKCYDTAEELISQNPEPNYSNLVNIENQRAQLYTKLGDRVKAEGHFIKAFEYANKTGDGKKYAELCKRISEFYAEVDDYKNAYDYQLLFEEVNSRNKDQYTNRRILELEVKYESEKRRQETEMLRLQAKSLQLKALRSQMNPHFMYNALNSIQNYITSNNATDASKYLAKFARLMRQSLDYSDLDVISLEKEIQFLDDYLAINEKLRFQGKLQYQISVDPEIEQDILGVPTMLIQPYVENSIEHGLRNREMGVVKIDFKLIDDYTIQCIVEDNGIGRKKAKELQEMDERYRQHESKGTRITEERLQVLHNSKTSQPYIETIDLKDPITGEPTGTRIEILLPIIEIHAK